MRPPVVLFADSAHPLQTLEPAVSRAAVNGCEQITIDIDGLPRFDVADGRELIRLLRVARDRGTNVALHAASPQRRRVLCEMGLDRIFAFSAQP